MICVQIFDILLSKFSNFTFVFRLLSNTAIEDKNLTPSSQRCLFGGGEGFALCCSENGKNNAECFLSAHGSVGNPGCWLKVDMVMRGKKW